MSTKDTLLTLLASRFLIIDGAMGTQIQDLKIPKEAWLDEQGVSQEGCNELLNLTAPELIEEIYTRYAKVGANLISTNTFGVMPWVLDEYGLALQSYEIAKAGAKSARAVCDQFQSDDEPRFVLGSLGPGTKLPSLGHIDYDEMFAGYKESALGLIDGGCDIFLLETCQDPLQIKAALHGCEAANEERKVKLPMMVSATIELSGTMLIGTDAATLATILEPFDLLSLGLNCGTGPDQVKKHLKKLSELSNFPLSIHANAGLPQNRGGYTYYPMGPDEFASKQLEFAELDGVSFLGGCCGTTPQHILALSKALKGKKPKAPSGSINPSIASLFNSIELIQKPAPLLIGERSNATGSKAFRELILASDYEGTLSVAQAQVRDGAHVLDLNVEFAGRDGAKDMCLVTQLYNQKIALPLMPDATRVGTIEAALKCIGGKPIINSVNLEDGEAKLDAICHLAKKFGTSLVCLVIDEKGMAKRAEDKMRIASRIYDLCVNRHGISPHDLIFDMLTFTVGSGDVEYRDAAVQTIEAVKQLHIKYPEVGSTLGLSNISFGLSVNARKYLNSIFLHHCIKAGLTSVIINVKHIVPLAKMAQADIDICEELLFRADDTTLFRFIEHFEDKSIDESSVDDDFETLSDEQKIHKLLLDGDKERILPLVLKAKDTLGAEKIVNEILIEAMKEVGELFGSGKMQLPFVLQSAETMKATVDSLQPYLPKIEKESDTTLLIGTVKGDVHDVGKNLVDIILSNNGFKVINIGIKTELEEYIDVLQKEKVHALGMSGLLVKSTAVMQENLEQMQKLGIKVPVLLGGAALTKSFVDDFCRPVYEGPIFYCRDAFDGVIAMSRIEKHLADSSTPLDVRLAGDLKEVSEPKKEQAEVVLPALDAIKMPSEVAIPTPPFWGRRVMNQALLDFDMVESWINKRNLFKVHWGYKRAGMEQDKYEKILESKVYPAYERIKKIIIEKGLFDPVVLYGYYPCRSDDKRLYLFDEGRGWHNQTDINDKALQKSDIRYTFEFPRQRKEPHRALSDYFASKRDDVVAFTCVSVGAKFSAYEKELYDAGEYLEYNMLHGFGAELAEALAEIVHKQIRLDLGILRDDEGASLRDVRMKRYEGARYSFGYPACPDLEPSKIIFELLRPEEFGITLSETYQIVPELSTTALVVHHTEASYYSI